jgi:undecaprenyl-diphosphatase
MLLNVLMKYAFHRDRPSFDHPLLSLTTYSFHSGHAAGSTLFYGVLAAFLVTKAGQWQCKRRLRDVVDSEVVVMCWR